MNSKFEGYSKVIKTYGILIVFFILVVFLARGSVEDFGPITLIPAAFLLVYIFYTKRILESLMLGGLLGFLMAHKGDFFSPLSESFLNIMINEDIGWLFIVCGLMGLLANGCPSVQRPRRAPSCGPGYWVWLSSSMII